MMCSYVLSSLPNKYLIPRFMIVVGTVRRVPVRMSWFAMVMVVMSPLVSGVGGGVYIGHHQLRTVFGRLPFMPSMAVFRPGCFVQLFPRLPIVSVQAATRLWWWRVQGGHRIAVRGHMMPVPFPVVVFPADVGIYLLITRSVLFMTTAKCDTFKYWMYRAM